MKNTRWKHLPYGIFKTGSSKIHPHNECGICGVDKISKKAERRKAKEEIDKEIEVEKISTEK